MKKRDLSTHTLLTTFEFLLNSRSHAESARMVQRWPAPRINERSTALVFMITHLVGERLYEPSIRKQICLQLRLNLIWKISAWTVYKICFGNIFYNFCVRSQSCLLCRSREFWKFSTTRFIQKSFGLIFTFYASRKEAVWSGIHRKINSFDFQAFLVLEKVNTFFGW